MDEVEARAAVHNAIQNHVITPADGVLTRWVVIAEYATTDSDAAYGVAALCDDSTPVWTADGLVRYALDEGLLAEAAD